LHGKHGEDGTLQGLLEMAGIPYVGCRTLSSAMCMDKDVAHKIAQLAGVKTPRSIVLNAKTADTQLLARAASLNYPLFVKPANAGSSIGITQVHQAGELQDALALAFEHDAKVIIEEAVDGFEVGCAILGTEALCLGELDEIELSGGFFDYVEKYTLKTSKIHLPARVDPETAVRIKQTAATVYRALNCSGFARVDLFVTPQQEIIFNEVNTIPGLTSHSRFPKMLQGIGLTFEQLVDDLISQAVNP
jgi:D-alanine---D-serine ligase